MVFLPPKHSELKTMKRIKPIILTKIPFYRFHLHLEYLISRYLYSIHFYKIR